MAKANQHIRAALAIKSKFARVSQAVICVACYAIASDLLSPPMAEAATLESAYKAGDFAYATYEANNIIKKDPKNLVAHYYLANIYARQGDYKQALTHYAFCAEFGKGTKVGVFAEAALKDMESKKAGATSGNGGVINGISVTGGNSASAGGVNGTSLNGNGGQPQTVEQLKIALLKEGSQKIEERRRKLQTDIDALKVVSDRESLKYLPESLRAQYKDTPPSYLTNLSDNPAINQFVESRKRYQAQMDSLKAQGELEITQINRSYLDKIDYIDQQPAAALSGLTGGRGSTSTSTTGLNGGAASPSMMGIRGNRYSQGNLTRTISRNSSVRNYVNYGTEDVVDTIPAEPALVAKPTKIDTAKTGNKSKQTKAAANKKTAKKAPSK